MKPYKIVSLCLITFLIIFSYALAGDFDWMKDFNIQAQMDPSGLKARLEARFKIGGADVDLVLGSVDQPAEAYMLFRLGEISQKPMAQIMEQYKSHKGQGWGSLAKSLGIKPGSEAFGELKQRQDLYDLGNNDQDKAKGKGKNKQRK